MFLYFSESSAQEDFWQWLDRKSRCAKAAGRYETWFLPTLQSARRCISSHPDTARKSIFQLEHYLCHTWAREAGPRHTAPPLNWPLSFCGAYTMGSCGSRGPSVLLLHYRHLTFCCRCLVTKSCLTFCDPMDCSTPGSSAPGVCSNSCPLSLWCRLTVSSSVTPFSSCPQSFPTSGSFPMSWLFASCGQSTGVSASASVLPMNIQDWFLLGLTGLISLLSKGIFKDSCLPPQLESITFSAIGLLYGAEGKW